MTIGPKKRRQAARGTVRVDECNGSLRLVWSYGGKRYFFSLGLNDSPYHRKLAQDKALEIQRDIGIGEFDPSLEKYRKKLQEKGLAAVEAVTVIKPVTLSQLWEMYVAHVSVGKSPKTIDGTYNPVTAHLKRCKTDGLEDPAKFRMELLQTTTTGQARRTLMQLAAVVDWGLEHDRIPTRKNQFRTMYRELPKAKAPPVVAFSSEEMEQIIQAFKTHQGSGMNYQCYAPFVEFLLRSGCRTCEAIGLRWGSVTPDCAKIHFHESIVEVSGKLVRRRETKTDEERWFSCPPKLQHLLQNVRPENPASDALVFSSPKGGAIGLSNFNDRAWKTILTQLGLYEKDGRKMTLYSTRRTWITAQAVAGNSSDRIAAWAGNSAQVIESRYMDKLKLQNLKPSDI
ncbi:integrase [Neosynechococcus sphagnicola sy1]|uniref:Integrase n=1 Tax=Neosynechococcus sphagnicola sy1 TaxID=1497020 RepID=A0A098THX0_9CYAN|nr:DUF3596 domain-containing protein [Neosynechococcus sphagnicola]KGF71704.1 integrase [Neosynechococcus sphagnicola sy1]